MNPNRSRARRRSGLIALLAGAAVALTTGVTTLGTADLTERAGPTVEESVLPAATTAGVPRFSDVALAMKRAADYYRTSYPLTTLKRNGWSWATYYEGVLQLFRTVGDNRYRTDAVSWAKATSGTLAAETDPDSIKAGQTYFDLLKLDSTISLTAMDTRMAADLAAPSAGAYWWSDALFMGLPDWPRWASRKADSRYLTKLDALYAWARDDGRSSALGCASKPPGLYDPVEQLWYRDCRFIGAPDQNGKKVFWARGNAWVLAAMADVLKSLPAGSTHAAAYTAMLRAMAARIAPLQGADGFWRPSLLDPALYPQPETSSTALFTYALAYGIRAGLLDRATYLPVVAKAWTALSGTALRPSGFVTDCQGVGDRPAVPFSGSGPTTPPSTTSTGSLQSDSPPFCVGAVLLAGSEVAALSPALSTGKPVTATAQQTGNEARRAVDGDMTTRWSAYGFPQTLTVDLGSAQTVSNALVVPYLDRAYRYRVQVSATGSSWTTVIDRTANTATGSHPDPFSTGPVSARYVRLTVTGIYGTATSWVSIQEFAVHGG